MQVPSVSVIMLAISALFLGLAAWDYFRIQRSTEIARKTWLRIAMIFGIIAGWLYFLQCQSVRFSNIP
jgi:hypothetical protein